MNLKKRNIINLNLFGAYIEFASYKPKVGKIYIN